MSNPSFSVIICSIDPWKFATCARHYESLLAGVPHEIIGIHDAKSLTEGYNRGLAQSRGDIIVFSHDDVLILDEHFAGKIIDRLTNYDILGLAGTRKLIGTAWFLAGHPFIHGVVAHAVGKRMTLTLYGVDDWPVAGGIQAIDGLLMIARRQTAVAVGFDAETFDGFHLYDLDFSFAAHLAGHKIGVCCDMPVIHASGGDFTGNWRRYAERFQEKYAGRLAPEPEPGSAGRQYKGAEFSGYRALVSAWNPDTLRRGTVGLRRHAGK